MNRAIRVLLVANLALLAQVAQAADAFILGVAPHTSARLILQQYLPLRLHLEKALKRPVEIVTAPDFTAFAGRAIRQEYDLAVTTGHQGRLLETDAKYIPLLTYQADFKAVVFVSIKSPVRSAQDLNGQKVLGLSASSLVTLWGQHWLREKNVNASVSYVSASDSVAQLVLSGEAVAGFVSLANFQSLSQEIRDQLRVIDQSPALTGRVYMLNGRFQEMQKEVTAALWSFADTREGKQYFLDFKLNGYRKLKEGELKRMDIYAAEVRKVLHETEK